MEELLAFQLTAVRSFLQLNKRGVGLTLFRWRESKVLCWHEKKGWENSRALVCSDEHTLEQTHLIKH